MKKENKLKKWSEKVEKTQEKNYNKKVKRDKEKVGLEYGTRK